jgi:hypothetical protein|tara:strand:- start:248 stop:610 length:363 start_codon:yes stop_codon:yes gene_type:complete
MTHNYFVFGILFVFFLISILAFSQDASSVASNVSTATVKNTDATIHLATSDLDFDNLSYTFNNPNNGTIVQYGKKDDGTTIFYIPKADFVGTDTFTASDGAFVPTKKTLTVALDASTTYY